MMLSDDERKIVRDLGSVWGDLCDVAGHSPSRECDLQEMAHHIHVLQRYVMSQSAARAHPGEFRLLGHLIDSDRMVETEPCGDCVDGWVGSDPRFEREEVCPTCDGDTVVPIPSLEEPG